MTEQEARYDRIAHGYGTWWAPVLEPAALALLDLVADEAPAARRMVDVGTGTGTLAVDAVRRWPDLEVLGVDASEAMLAAARRTADARLGTAGGERDRLAFAQGYADRLPVDDGWAGVLVSSFVFQLVPSRGRALREAFRVLAPGGRLAFVTWLAGADRFGADEAFDDALDAVGLDGRPDDGDDDGRAGDLPSLAAAAAQARRAGYRGVRVREGRVSHAFTPESYLGFLSEFDEEDLFRGLEPGLRARLETELLARLRALPRAALRLELPVAYLTARRPGGGD